MTPGGDGGREGAQHPSWALPTEGARPGSSREGTSDKPEVGASTKPRVGSPEVAVVGVKEETDPKIKETPETRPPNAT